MIRRVKRRRRRSQQYSAAQVSSLLTGFYMNRRTKDADWHPRVWADIGSYLLGEYVERFPGYRPYAWWAYEAPEYRRVLVGSVVWPEHVPPGYWFGLPSSHPPLAWEEPFQEFESTAEYLSRLDLLTVGERSADLDHERVFYPKERDLDASPIVEAFAEQ